MEVGVVVDEELMDVDVEEGDSVNGRISSSDGNRTGVSIFEDVAS